jgi:hypothetical protein
MEPLSNGMLDNKIPLDLKRQTSFLSQPLKQTDPKTFCQGLRTDDDGWQLLVVPNQSDVL